MGARRGNILFDALDGERRHRLVVTIYPPAGAVIAGVEGETGALRLGEGGRRARRPRARRLRRRPLVRRTVLHLHPHRGENSLPRNILRRVEAQAGMGERIGAQLGAAFAAIHAVPAAAGRARRAASRSARCRAQPGWTRRAARAARRVDTAIAGALRWGCGGCRTIRRTGPRSTRWCTATCATETSLSVTTGWPPSWIGKAATPETRTRTWRGCVCARGDSATIRWRSAASPPGTDGRRLPGCGRPVRCSHAFEWWKVFGTLKWGLGLARQARQHLDGTYRYIAMAGSGRRVCELESTYSAAVEVAVDRRCAPRLQASPSET